MSHNFLRGFASAWIPTNTVAGVELEILKGVNYSKFRFRYICVESRQFDELNEYLLSQEYDYVDSLSNHDYLLRDITKFSSDFQS